MWRLLRAEHGLMAGLAVVIGEIVAFKGLPPLKHALLGFLVASSLNFACFAFNDVCDLEVDRVNRPDRPLVKGELSVKEALLLTAFLTFIGLACSTLQGLTCFLIALLFSAFGLYYDYKLKETGVPGNIYIAASMAIPFIYGSLAVKGFIERAVAFFSLMAFLAGLGREVAKGIVDVPGDAIRNVKTIARVYGVKTAALVSFLFFLFAISLSPLPYFLGDVSAYYIPLVVLADLVLFASSLKLLLRPRGETAESTRKETLLGIWLGLMAFLVGSLT